MQNGEVFLFDSDAKSEGGSGHTIKDIMDRYKKRFGENDVRGWLHGSAATKAFLTNPDNFQKYGMTLGGFSVMNRKYSKKSNNPSVRSSYELTGGTAFKSCTLNSNWHWKNL